LRQLVLFEVIGDEIKPYFADDPQDRRIGHPNDGRMGGGQ
jgi:hypothetical protein